MPTDLPIYRHAIENTLILEFQMEPSVYLFIHFWIQHFILHNDISFWKKNSTIRLFRKKHIYENVSVSWCVFVYLK